MKMLMITCFCVLSWSTSKAYLAGIAIQAEKSSSMQVYVNGKLHNREPGRFVRIRSLPGLFHIELKVFNPHDKRWYLVRKDIRARKGYEVYYKVVFVRGRTPLIKEIKQYPVYTPYFINPSLYNRNAVS